MVHFPATYVKNEESSSTQLEISVPSNPYLGPPSMLDIFILNRSAMDFYYAHFMLTEAKKCKENPMTSSPSREGYRKHLGDSFNINRTRILAFRNKPPTPTEAMFNANSASVQHSKPVKARRYIPQLRTLRGGHHS